MRDEAYKRKISLFQHWCLARLLHFSKNWRRLFKIGTSVVAKQIFFDILWLHTVISSIQWEICEQKYWLMLSDDKNGTLWRITPQNAFRENLKKISMAFT